MIVIINNEWGKYEGEFDNEYLPTGTGNWQDEDGRMYEGEYKRGNMHGRGKGVLSDGRSYEGELKDNDRHGQGSYSLQLLGRITHPDGRYTEGQWEDAKEIGVHMVFNKEGKLIRLATFEGGELVNKENFE